MSTVYTIKLKRKPIRTSFYVEKESSKIVTGSGLIGKKVERTSTTITYNLPLLTSNESEELLLNQVQVTKNVRLFGEATQISLDDFRYGKDVKITKHLLNDKLLTNITLSDEGINDGDDEFSNSIGYYNFGQSKIFKTASKNFKVIPFRDMNGKTKSENFLSKNQNIIEGFPYVYNAKTEFNQFIDSRDRIYYNGVIDVFHRHLRLSELTDIRLKGAKCLLGHGDFILTQNDNLTKKGSPLESDLFETKITNHDFFEDANEVILEMTGSANQVGYISTGKFKLSPFAEQNLFAGEYSHLTVIQRDTLLVSSSKEDYEIGTRFKSKQNGFIITPFYKLNQKKSFGKDSIAFSGLMKG
jgi:hypothetical protein